MKYPNGIRPHAIRYHQQKQTSYSNRGMTLEEDINLTNNYYQQINKAIIHKKPTPIQVVKVNYPKRSAAVITEAYFKNKSTTDYNGIYRGRYIDFEAKETKNKNYFPLSNFHTHQFEHMENIIQHGGIAFAIIRFTSVNETYFMDASIILDAYKQMQNGGRKSIPMETFKNSGILIQLKYQARVDYLPIVDNCFFNK